MSENLIHKNPFRLLSTQAVECVLNAKPSHVIQGDYQFNFTHQILQLQGTNIPSEQTYFIIEFAANVYNNAKTLTLSVKFHVWFQAENPVTPEYLDSPGIKINAPAIAFPFLRSFITTISSNAGYPPIILPSVNFVRLITPTPEQLK
jgi:hypothetical protein